MKILVIPDVHLKPQMFKQATALMHQGIADRAVCLMDTLMIGTSNIMSDFMKKLMMRLFGLQKHFRKQPSATGITI